MKQPIDPVQRRKYKKQYYNEIYFHNQKEFLDALADMKELSL